MRAPLGDTARRAGLLGPADQARGIQQARHAHFRDGLNNARTADAGDARRRDGLIKFRIIGPQVTANHAESRFLGRGVDFHAFNRARRGALAGTDLGTLERGTGGGGTGQHALLVPQQDFGIGADVHDQDQVLGFLRLFGQGDGGGIRPHVPRDTGQDIGPCAGVDRTEVQVGCAHVDGVRHGERKRRLAQLNRIDPQQQVVHHGVTDHGEFDNRLRVDLGVRAERCRQFVQRLAHGGGHFTVPTGMHHGIGDAAHQVFAEPDLRVHDARTFNYLAGA